MKNIAVRVTLILLLWASGAYACSCAFVSNCGSLGGPGHPVFVGSVLEVTDIKTDGEALSFLTSKRARLRVDEEFGGTSGRGHRDRDPDGRGGGDCGVPFAVGQQYLVDAGAGQDGRLRASICSNTRRIDAAAVLLDMLCACGKPTSECRP